jgi:uncharacterized membrane protein YjgN (DUF898 family)
MRDHIRTPAFHGTGGSLFAIQIKTTLLGLVTLGIYTFWGRTEARRYLYGQTAFDGERFAYHGTGGELLRGWLKAMGLLFLILIGGGLVARLVHPLVGGVLLYAAFAFGLFPFALVGARKYRLSRTSWRGIRFSFRGDWEDLLEVYVPGALLTLVTLGVYFPFFHANVRRFLVNHSRFGTEAFAFDGVGRDLLGPHVLAMLLTPLTLGIYWCWYAAFRDRYYWAHTSIGEARFRSTVTGGGLLALAVTNALLVMVTLGFGYSWAVVRTIRYHSERVALEGPADFAAIRQDATPAGELGEGLTDMLDVSAVGADFFGL